MRLSGTPITRGLLSTDRVLGELSGRVDQRVGLAGQDSFRPRVVAAAPTLYVHDGLVAQGGGVEKRLEHRQGAGFEEGRVAGI